MFDSVVGRSEAGGVRGADAGLHCCGTIDIIEEGKAALGIGFAFLSSVEFGRELNGVRRWALEKIGDEAVRLCGLTQLAIERGKAHFVFGGEVDLRDKLQLKGSGGEIAFFGQEHCAGATLVGGGGFVLSDSVDVGACTAKVMLCVQKLCELEGYDDVVRGDVDSLREFLNCLRDVFLSEVGGGEELVGHGIARVLAGHIAEEEDDFGDVFFGGIALENVTGSHEREEGPLVAAEVSEAVDCGGDEGAVGLGGSRGEGLPLNLNVTGIPFGEVFPFLFRIGIGGEFEIAGVVDFPRGVGLLRHVLVEILEAVVGVSILGEPDGTGEGELGGHVVELLAAGEAVLF